MANPELSPPVTAPRFTPPPRTRPLMIFPNPLPMRALTVTESNVDDDSLARSFATAGSFGPRAVATIGESPRESEACADSSAASTSASHRRASRLASAASAINSNPLPSAHLICAAVTAEIEPETQTICDRSGAGSRSAMADSIPVARQWATSAYSTPCEPIAKMPWPRPFQIRPPTHCKVSSSTTSSDMIDRPRRNSASSSSRPAPRFMATKSTSPIARLVCPAMCKRTSASSIGVTGCRCITGCRSRRWMEPSWAANRLPKAWYRPMAGAATTSGCQTAAPGFALKIRTPMSMARPIEPTVGEESKCRTHLIVRHGRLELRERLEDLRQMNIHPVRRLCAGDGGDADRAVAGELAELLGRGDFDEHHCRKAGEGHHLHDSGRAREVVAAEG